MVGKDITVVMAVGLNTLAKGVRTGVASKSRILYINGICAHALLNKPGNLFQCLAFLWYELGECIS